MAYSNKTENETSLGLNESRTDLFLGQMLLPSAKVVAKKLLILSKTRYDAKSTRKEGAKASKNGQSARSTQNLIFVHIQWIKEEEIIYVKSVGHFHSNRKEFNLSPTSWVNAPFIILLAIMRTASSLKRKKHM